MDIRGICDTAINSEAGNLSGRLSASDMPDIDMFGVDVSKNEIKDSDRDFIELPQMYAPSMEIQAERIKSIYEAIPEIHYENWKSLDIHERRELLNEFERGIAAIERRPAMPVEYEKLSDGHMGYNDGRKLVISEKIMSSNDFSDYKTTLNTLFHEGRHSYQNYNLYVHRTEQSDETFNAWKVNREKLGYSSGNTSFPFNLSESFRQKSYYQYYTQPVEVDARLFAETVENKLDLNARGAYD